MVPWAIIKILSSDYKMAIGLLIIWGIGQLARQLIQPKIVGDSVGMPPLPTLFLLYIGYKLGGVVGMIVAVPIGLIALTMYQEGALQTTKDSVKILTAGINHFRRLKPEDMDEVRQMQERDRRLSEELARQAAEEEAQKKPKKKLEKKLLQKTERKEIMRNIRLRLQYGRNQISGVAETDIHRQYDSGKNGSSFDENVRGACGDRSQRQNGCRSACVGTGGEFPYGI